LTLILTVIVHPIVAIFEVINTNFYILPTRIVPDLVIIDSYLNGILTSMDTINSSINRQFSHLPVYRHYQNTSICANIIEDAKLNFRYDPFQSITNTEELQYCTVESKCHAFIQLNEATKETLSLLNEGEFDERICEMEALEHERRTLLLLVDNLDELNIDILDDFIENSS